VLIRALLFDYGGTLDGGGHWLARFAALYRTAGIDLAPHTLAAAFQHAEACTYGDPDVRRASLADVIERHVHLQLTALDLRHPRLQRHLAGRFLADSYLALGRHRRVLEHLASTFVLGVVSNFYGNVDRVLAETGIASLLSTVVDSAVVGFAKPDPRIFACALRALRCRAGETLHVGDSYARDIIGARAAGLRTAWLNANGEAPPADAGVVDISLRSLHELPVRLAALNSRPATLGAP